jgi:hypothetical protein
MIKTFQFFNVFPDGKLVMTSIVCMTEDDRRDAFKQYREAIQRVYPGHEAAWLEVKSK